MQVDEIFIWGRKRKKNRQISLLDDYYYQTTSSVANHNAGFALVHQLGDTNSKQANSACFKDRNYGSGVKVKTGFLNFFQDMLLDFFTNSRARTETIMSKSSLKTFDQVGILIKTNFISCSKLIKITQNLQRKAVFILKPQLSINCHHFHFLI